MTRQNARSRWAFRTLLGASVLFGGLQIAGTARADYNIKATEAAGNTFVEDGKCNLVEAIDSVNNGKTAAGSGLHGCVNVGGGKRIVLEGTGAHYNIGTGISIWVTGVEITSKVAGKDFVEGPANLQLITVQFGAGLTLTGLTVQRTGTGIAQVLNNQGSLTVTNCVVQGGNTQTTDGGGIYNNGDLHVSGSTLKNNHSGHLGGGIYTRSAAGAIISATTLSNNTSSLSGAGIYGDNSPVSLVQSTIINNNSSSNAGAIYNNNSTLYMDRVTIQSNTALKNGGAIYNYLGTLTMTGGKVTGTHKAVYGGGIYNFDGVVVLTAATIEGASASADGGGIYSSGGDTANLQLSQTTVQNNKATGNGGGIYSTSGGGMYVETSTISNNTASLNGGGIYSASRFYGTRSTVSTNTAQGNGGGIYSTPGSATYLELHWSTIGYNKAAWGAGVHVDHNSTRTDSSIVAKNQLPDGTFQDYIGFAHGEDGDLAVEVRSVFGEFNDTNNPDPLHIKLNDIFQHSNILPLANNGGLTKTHEIPTNSTAFNAAVGSPTCSGSDQRGQPRPVGGTCDIGSYERQ